MHPRGARRGLNRPPMNEEGTARITAGPAGRLGHPPQRGFDRGQPFTDPGYGVFGFQFG